MSKKLTKIFIILFPLLIVSCASSTNSNSSKEEPSSYKEPDIVETDPISFAPLSTKIVLGSYEWGPAVDGIIMEFHGKIRDLDKDKFTLKNGNKTISIQDAYISDELGNRLDEGDNDSHYIVLKLPKPTNSNMINPFTYNSSTGFNNWATNINISIDVNDDSAFTINYAPVVKENVYSHTFTKEEHIIPSTYNWIKDTYEGEKYTLNRAYWAPNGAEEDNIKNPLIIWLHGAGEGGLDPDIAIIGNEVTGLTTDGSGDNVQHYFAKDGSAGAYVLAVQTPTIWMDKGNGQYNDQLTGNGQESIYSDVLFDAISDFVDNHDDIDTDRIYLGGCSNGGYMTMNMMFTHNDYFTAYYPICEAYMNGNITDQMINDTLDSKVWMLCAQNDSTVLPSAYTLPTFYRYIGNGAENFHLTMYSSIKGKDDPSYYNYYGHFSWIYAFNDDVRHEFDNDKVLEDYPNVQINSKGEISNRITVSGSSIRSNSCYVNASNCTKEANMWEWLSEQSK